MKTRRAFRESELEEIRIMHGDGMTTAQIAKKLGRNTGSIHGKMVELDLPFNHGPRRKNPYREVNAISKVDRIKICQEVLAEAGFKLIMNVVRIEE